MEKLSGCYVDLLCLRLLLSSQHLLLILPDENCIISEGILTHPADQGKHTEVADKARSSQSLSTQLHSYYNHFFSPAEQLPQTQIYTVKSSI